MHTAETFIEIPFLVPIQLFRFYCSDSTEFIHVFFRFTDSKTCFCLPKMKKRQ